MSFIVDNYNYYLYELADSRVANWPILNSPLYLVSIIAVYLWFVLSAGPRFMKNRAPYNLRSILQAYNIFQVVVCFVLIYGVLTNGYIQGRLKPLTCHPVDYSTNYEPMRLAAWAWWVLMVKIAELIETVFFVLRKKQNQVSTLHLYHHVSTLIYAWFSAKFIAGGMVTFLLLPNCVVHIVMYTYYYLAALGPDWQKRIAWIKPKITIMQMVQFVLLLIHCTVILRPDCPVPNLVAYAYIPNIVLMFYLFFDFYRNSYLKRKSK